MVSWGLVGGELASLVEPGHSVGRALGIFPNIPPPLSPLGTMPRVIGGGVSGLTPPANPTRVIRGLWYEIRSVIQAGKQGMSLILWEDRRLLNKV